MANTWNPMDSAPSKRPVWIISMDCPQPTPYLGIYDQLRFSKIWGWRVCSNRNIGMTPTHWREVDVPTELPQ